MTQVETSGITSNGTAESQASEQSTPTQIQLASHAALGMPNRPIEESHLEIVGTLMGGNRPIVKAESASIALVPSEDSVGAMANRPVGASDLHVTGILMNRPVASNQVDNPYTLMGYLD
ncbi:MAG: hypothetical protein ACFBSC_05115 [Microcoleaceae cyanobacterium]